MNFDLARAMRAATVLTRTGKLGDATRLIQSALRKKMELDGRDLPKTPGRSADGRQINQTPAEVSPDQSRPRRQDPSPLSRPRRSLGEIVKGLRATKRFAAGAVAAASHRGPPSIPEGAQFLSLTASARAGVRDFKLYLPRNRLKQGLPLVVMLHGCTQDPDDFAVGTGMNDLAEEFGFLVAYPQQPKTANPSSCWNWFAPKDQVRDGGEPEIIAALTTGIVEQYALDRRRVFVAGLSAGGAMATVLAATYPDIYAAVGVHSGLPYRAARDVVSAFAAMRGGSVNQMENGENGDLRTIIFHGDADQTVHPSNGMRIAEASGVQHGDTRSIEGGLANGRLYERVTVRGADGAIRVEHWRVRGAGHAWSGGNAAGSFADPEGPNASREMVRFFLNDASTGQ